MRDLRCVMRPIEEVRVMRPIEELREKQSLTLDQKIDLTMKSIETFYGVMNGKVYVSFSGGKDSTVLLHLVRSRHPEVPAVFMDTGLEYPEIIEFVKTIDNVEVLKPKLSFYEVLNKYGFPFPSKEQALYIRQYTTTKSDKLKDVRWNGKNGRFKISNKWKFLAGPSCPYKISEKCCDILKKNPAHKYERLTGRKPFIGTMATDSRVRERLYLRNGCVVFEKGKEKSTPLSWWTEKDVWDYIKKNNIPYSSIYDTGIDRTGCIYCLFGVVQDKGNRFEVLKKLHPQLYKYCMENLKIGEFMEYVKDNTQKDRKDGKTNNA